MKALVIGGTGPTGQHVVRGLLERGYDTTILHRGVHEPPDLSDVRHIHADPHFTETLREAIGAETFDVVLGMYGRVRLLPEVFADRCGHLICVGGVVAYRGLIDPASARPYGMRVLAREDSPLADTAVPVPKFAQLVLAAERAVLDGAATGGFHSTVVRYPAIYGPHSAFPWEWAVIKRILDGRRRMILPDAGLWVISRCAARNAAEVLLRVVDQPQVASGQVYNCADDDQFTVRQWAELVASALGQGELEFIGIPAEIAPSALADLLPPEGAPHAIVDASKVKRDLGYREVVSAQDALVETVQWLAANPVTPENYPVYPGKFDYAAEDRLIERYQGFVEQVRQERLDETPERVHGMPHPKVPSLTVDERGR